jgi:hypothetical protein
MIWTLGGMSRSILLETLSEAGFFRVLEMPPG